MRFFMAERSRSTYFGETQMKTAKTIVLVFVLGMFGYVYADQSTQSTTHAAHLDAKHCKMCAKDASCCVPGAACCKEGAECCKAGGECCKGESSCCSASTSAATADAKHKEHAGCSKKTDDSKSGCCGSGCSMGKASKK
jgi:hypothetical protein